MTTFARELLSLRRRLVREAGMATDMLEAAIAALWSGDAESAQEVRDRDELVDAEEVAIESECLRLLALKTPVGSDLRQVAFCLKVNQDIERVADHACSIAKMVGRIESDAPSWPTALVELGERVPLMCYETLRVVLGEDVEGAQEVVRSDKLIDRLDRRLFDEVRDQLARDPDNSGDALISYRLGRELERVGDLMANIAEDLVYLVTGEIVRHQKKLAKQSAPPPPTAPSPSAPPPTSPPSETPHDPAE